MMPRPPGTRPLDQPRRPWLQDVEYPEKHEGRHIGAPIERSDPEIEGPSTAQTAATSSMTTHPGSFCPSAWAAGPATQQPTAKTTTAPPVSAAGPPNQAIAQPQGRAAKAPHVPGAYGSSPAPNQLASSIAGWRSSNRGRGYANDDRRRVVANAGFLRTASMDRRAIAAAARSRPPAPRCPRRDR